MKLNPIEIIPQDKLTSSPLWIEAEEVLMHQILGLIAYENLNQNYNLYHLNHHFQQPIWQNTKFT